MISKVNIKNFKSIENLNLDCKKINLFIGKPNVGKSNILECLSLFGTSSTTDIRLESTRNLFYDLNIGNVIQIQIDDFHHFIRYDFDKNSYRSYVVNSENTILRKKLFPNKQKIKSSLDDDFFKELEQYKKHTLLVSDLNEEGVFSNEFSAQNTNLPKIKKYTYRETSNSKSNNFKNSISLNDPYGENIFSLLKNNKALLQEVSELFKEYGYSLVIDYVSDIAEIQKMVGNISYKIPYSLVADTLKRVVFYLVAIRTNRDCSILLEEPENHSFPPYIRDIAFEVINSENQFFIATHSPYLLNTIISEADIKDVAVNIVSYADFKTSVTTMTNEEISELSNYGIDLFFNLNIFSQ